MKEFAQIPLDGLKERPHDIILFYSGDWYYREFIDAHLMEDDKQYEIIFQGTDQWFQFFNVR